MHTFNSSQHSRDEGRQISANLRLARTTHTHTYTVCVNTKSCLSGILILLELCVLFAKIGNSIILFRESKDVGYSVYCSIPITRTGLKCCFC